MSTYYERNKEKLRLYQLDYSRRNKHKIKVYQEKNKEKLKKYDIEYKKNNRKLINEKCLLLVKAYYKKNPKLQNESILKSIKKQAEIHGMTVNKYRYGRIAWAKIIKLRDKRCVICENDIKLIAHHILFRSYSPLLQFNINNGITLCKKCHKEAHDLNGWGR